jgi:hypothetical protein
MPALQLVGKLGANAFGGEVAGDAAQMDFLSDTMKATLHTDTWVPNVDTNEVKADATNELTTANGYTAGGITLATKTVSYNATGGVTTFSADDFSWTAAGGAIAFRYVVLWDDTPTTPADPLLGYMDANGGAGNLSIASGNTFTVDITASGIWTATVTGA